MMTVAAACLVPSEPPVPWAMARSQFARWIGLFAAGIGAVSAIAWIPYYPVWSVVYIGMGVLVIYALAVHGGREPSH